MGVKLPQVCSDSPPNLVAGISWDPFKSYEHVLKHDELSVKSAPFFKPSKGPDTEPWQMILGDTFDFNNSDHLK